MTRNFIQRPRLSIALMLLISASIASSEEEMAPGAAPSGYLLLGTDDDLLSISTCPSGANLPLQYGSTATALDSITISVDNAAWMLTVVDANAAISNYDGKMRKGSLGSELSGWSYSVPDLPLSNNFAVLVDNVDDNSNLPGTVDLTDCNDLSTSSPQIIAEGSGESSLTIALQYSQTAVANDAEGAYRIDIIYTLSSKSA